ncbi:MAG: glutathione S-transferase family protein [Pseudomonadota bacterium]
MSPGLTLHGYRFSVYAWIVRLVLQTKGLEAAWVEVDPFEDLPHGYLGLHPFGRVPVLTHGETSIYETRAITAYLDEAFPAPPLTPRDLAQRTRMRQILGMIDAYAYWPLVRQVFSHGAWRSRMGGEVDGEALAAGFARAPRVLAALEDLAEGGPTLIGEGRSLADCHLAPMLSYFTETPGAPEMLADVPKLSRWWQGMATEPAFQATRPDLG